jgi:hypothetical protein
MGRWVKALARRLLLWQMWMETAAVTDASDIIMSSSIGRVARRVLVLGRWMRGRSTWVWA